MPKLYELLGTKDRKLQEQRVQLLLQKAKAPVIDLVIRYDPRVDEVHLELIGADTVPIAFLYDILDSARKFLQEQELIEKLQAAEQAVVTPPATPPAEIQPARPAS